MHRHFVNMQYATHGCYVSIPSFVNEIDEQYSGSIILIASYKQSLVSVKDSISIQ